MVILYDILAQIRAEFLTREASERILELNPPYTTDEIAQSMTSAINKGHHERIVAAAAVKLTLQLAIQQYLRNLTI